MPVRIEANAEPIPGYRLIERLGGGGFGEVWKAEAPGGLLKAIKFVFGDLEAADDADGVRATQELKALSRVKTVHHPYILSLERYDIIDGQLIIVMELADRTLWDRFRECRQQGLPGIPRAELLTYVQETAEALDLMNIQFQLQHLDIKPQNLFLVYDHVKVADFGLVKDLGNMAAATVTGGVTPVYAAPETFDGWLSRFSDQYSLAIVFQELLTGQRPFAGSTMRQLVLQHLQGEPDVSSLPVQDRTAVRRALAKNPDDRFPTCAEFVHALRAGAAPVVCVPTALPNAQPPPAPPQVDTEKNIATPRDPADGEITRNAHGNLPRPTPTPDDSTGNREWAQVLPPRPMGLASDPKKPLSEPRPITFNQAHRVQPASHSAPPADSACRGVVQPSLVVGLGKLGLQTALVLRRILSHEFGHPDAVPHIRLVGIDTDPEAIQAAGHGDSHSILRPHELILTRLRRPSHYLQLRDRDGKLPTDSWLNSKLIYRMPKQQTSAGLRALGRLAFVDNYRLLSKRLETELQACAAQDTLHELVQNVDLGIRSAIPRVYVVSGLAGTTGSGMFIDTAYALRNMLHRQGFAKAEIIGVFFLPSVEREGIRSEALAQSYAALTELNHYATGQSVFSASYEVSDPNAAKPISETGPPFDRCYFLNLPAPTSGTLAAQAIPETLTLAGQFLFRDIATPLGKALDTLRRPDGLAGPASSPMYQSLGLYRIVWPRKALLDQAARRLSKRLVDRWMSKDAKSLEDKLATWAQEQWDAAELRPEGLIVRHQELCEIHLKQSPERMLQGVLSPLVKVLTPPGSEKSDAPLQINLLPVVGAMGSLEKLLGVPDDCRDGNLANATPGVLEQALAEVAGSIAEASDHQLSELIVRLLEEPAYRLAGAEEGLRQFSKVAEQALQSQETLNKELHERAATLYRRIQSLLETPPAQNVTQSQSMWKLGFSRKSQGSSNHFGADLLELVRIYAKSRYQCLVLEHINRLYVSLRGHLSDQIREIGFCRQRLAELGGLVQEKAPAAPPPVASFEKLLLPHGCTTIEQSLQRLDELVTKDDLLAFDNVLQPIIRQQYRALVNVCMGPSNLVRTLAPLMVQEAESFMAPRFQGASVAEMWMIEQGGDNNTVAADLSAAYDAAAPELGRKTARQDVAVVAFPKTAAGQQLKALAQQSLRSVHLIDADRDDEIVFFRESGPFALNELEQCNPLAQEAYRQRCAVDPTALHTRSDVPAWQTAG